MCPKNYHKNFTKVTNHIKAVHLNVKKKCKICDKIYALGAFRGHMDDVHGNGNSNEMIKCDLCDYSTTLKRNYRKHVRQMHTKREKTLLCDQCDQRFELPYQLKDHKAIVHEGNSKKLQSCDQCDKKFRYPHQVKDHKNLVHLGKLLYKYTNP